MDLKTFVKETLTQIAEGVNEAKPIVAKTNCYIIDRKPSGFDDRVPNCICEDNHYHPVTKIDFDIALQAMQEDGTKGGLLVSFANLMGGASKENKTSSADTSRVCFSIYMAVQ